MFGRFFASFCAVATYYIMEFVASPVATLGMGKVTGQQLNPSDGDYLSYNLWSNVFHFVDIFAVWALVATLFLIWFKPLKDFIMSYKKDAKDASKVLLVLLGLMVLFTPQAKAYYDTYDWAENYFILPNESAFYIPDVGDNKTAQASFMSEEYLKLNKIAAKRFQMPHVKIPKTGWTVDSYAPAGRLIIVDRMPSTRAWVDAHDRGTSNKKEGFPCQDNGGLDITVGISIGVAVHEENAPKFLYNFGIHEVKGNRLGDKPDPAVVFQSVYTGRSLSEVMDTNIRDKVHSLVCDEMTLRPLDENNKQAKAIMAHIEEQVKTYLDSVGISLMFIGWADTFSFDAKVQDALNRKYEAVKNAEIASQMAPYVGTLQGLAWVDSIRELGKKWNGSIPSQVSLFTFDGIKDWFKSFWAPTPALPEKPPV
jgi:hypothetical protein